jgi:hypothetical protein
LIIISTILSPGKADNLQAISSPFNSLR